MKDKDGKISSNDLFPIFQGNAHHKRLKIDKIFHQLGVEKNNPITYDEFNKWIIKNINN